MHIKVVTEKDRAREKRKILKRLSEIQKTDIIFNGEHFYDIGGGHDFVFGFFDSYITKSGVEANDYCGTWRIGGEHGGEFTLNDGEWTRIERPEPIEVDWSNTDLTFPVVKNPRSRLLADAIVPVVPMAGPHSRKFIWQILWNWIKRKR